MRTGEWREGKLADVCDSIDYGLTASASDNPAGPKLLRITDIVRSALNWRDVPHVQASDKDVERFRLNDGDIVIARTGATTGESRYIIDPPRAVFASYLVRLRINHQNSARFISYWLKSPAFRGYLHGLLGDKSAQPNASASAMTQAPLSIPADLEEQRAIAAILGALDDKIELNRRMNETLEAMARAIFNDWFVDFGPTRAKAEGRAPYLSSDLWDLFPDALDDEDTPVGWARGVACDLFDFNPRERIVRWARAPYLNMAALPTNGLVPDAPSEREYKSGSKFRDGDTLFARITPCLENGKTAFVFGLGDGVIGTGSTEFIVIRSRKPVPAATSYLLSRSPAFRRHAERSMTGTSGRQRANADAVAQFNVALPNETGIWQAMSEIIDPMFDRIIGNAYESRTLARTRDLLLPKLMSGEIRLAQAEKELEAVA